MAEPEPTASSSLDEASESGLSGRGAGKSSRQIKHDTLRERLRKEGVFGKTLWILTNLPVLWRSVLYCILHDPVRLAYQLLFAAYDTYQSLWRLDLNYAMVDGALQALFSGESQAGIVAATQLAVKTAPLPALPFVDIFRPLAMLSTDAGRAYLQYSLAYGYRTLVLVKAVASIPQVRTFITSIVYRLAMEALQFLITILRDVLSSLILDRGKKERELKFLRKKADLDLIQYEDKELELIMNVSYNQPTMTILFFIQSAKPVAKMILFGSRILKDISWHFLAVGVLFYFLNTLHESDSFEGVWEKRSKYAYHKHLLTRVESKMELTLYGAYDYIYGKAKSMAYEQWRDDAGRTLSRIPSRLAWFVFQQTKQYALIIYLALGPLLRGESIAAYKRDSALLNEFRFTISEFRGQFSSVVEQMCLLSDFFAFVALKPHIKRPARPQPLNAGIAMSGRVAKT